MSTVEVWWATLVAADRGLLGLLDDTERARVESLDRPADRGRSLLGAALLRVAGSAYTGIPPAELVLDRTCAECGAQHGAPRLLGPGPMPHVSVSHSGVLVVVALSGVGAVGVDVQRVADLPDPSDAAEWVRREALTKAGPGGPHTAPGAEGLTVRLLRAPLPGYATALATTAGAETLVDVRHWPQRRPGPSSSR